jgi:hypothetical protein
LWAGDRIPLGLVSRGPRWLVSRRPHWLVSSKCPCPGRRRALYPPLYPPRVSGALEKIVNWGQQPPFCREGLRWNSRSGGGTGEKRAGAYSLMARIGMQLCVWTEGRDELVGDRWNPAALHKHTPRGLQNVLVECRCTCTSHPEIYVCGYLPLDPPCHACLCHAIHDQSTGADHT